MTDYRTPDAPREPLGRADAQRWQLQKFANRYPSEKELEVRQGLAAVLDMQDLIQEVRANHGPTNRKS